MANATDHTFSTGAHRAASVLPDIPPTAIIRPRRAWRLIDLGELWRFRDLLYFLTWRDVKVRYKQTVLGGAWAILQPLLLMLVFTIFFGRLARVSTGDTPYSLFVYAGLLPWTFFAAALANAGNSVVGSERLITKVRFPRLTIPLAAVGAAIVDFVFAFAMLVGLMLWYGVLPGIGLLLALACSLPIILLVIGVGTLLAALNVAYRDFRYVIPFLIQIWMFATPTIYMQPSSIESGTVRTLLMINPLTALVGAFRAAALEQPILWGDYAIASALAAAVFIVGCGYFQKAEDEFADII
jgi:lipopolysaccharide transport system permease protein